MNMTALDHDRGVPPQSAAALGAAIVRDEAAARFLADGRTGLMVGCFLQRETSVAEAAQRFSMPPARMAY
jgi:hypothetical protein